MGHSRESFRVGRQQVIVPALQLESVRHKLSPERVNWRDGLQLIEAEDATPGTIEVVIKALSGHSRGQSCASLYIGVGIHDGVCYGFDVEETREMRESREN